MQSGKLKADFKDGQVEISYEISEGQFAKFSAPVGAVINPMIDQMKEKIQSGEIDLIKGTDMDKSVVLMGLDALKKFVG